MRSLIVVVLALTVVAGCSKKPRPSAEFESASREFSQLYGEKLDDAFVDPRIEDIQARLERVPADSRDAQAAQALLARIRDGRQRMEANLAERERLTREAAQPSAYTGPVTGDAPTDAEPGRASDAGTPAQAAHPARGMTEAELTTRFGDCFVKGELLEITGRGPRATWDLRATDACKAAHPGFDAQFIVIEDGKILALAPRSGIQTRVTETTRTVYVDAGTRDAGVRPTQQPPDAGR
jgi:hypothetical protein